MNKEKNKKEKVHKNNDKGQIFVKIMAGMLALLMVVAASGTLIFAIMG